jgi:hypothetical protein
MRRRLRIGLAVLSVASIGGVALIAASGSVEPDTLWFEIAKTILQVGVVLALGALLSLLTSDYQREQQRAESRQEVLRDILGRATTSYNDVKRARRLLRAHAMTKDGTAILAGAYDNQIAAINDAQLQFETMADEIQGAFPDLAVSLATEFDTVEKSLNALLSEYEDNRPNFEGEPLELGIDHLPALNSFLEHPTKAGASRAVTTTPGFAPVHNAFHRAQLKVWDQFLQTQRKDRAKTGR